MKCPWLKEVSHSLRSHPVWEIDFLERLTGFNFRGKAAKFLWVWMAVIYAMQPVHCVKLNCLLFWESMEAWWLCRLFFFFLKGDRLHSGFGFVFFCFVFLQGSNFTPKASYFRGTVELNYYTSCLGWHAWQQVPGFQNTLMLTAPCLFTNFLFIDSFWQHNNLLQEHQ